MSADGLPVEKFARILDPAAFNRAPRANAERNLEISNGAIAAPADDLALAGAPDVIGLPCVLSFEQVGLVVGEEVAAKAFATRATVIYDVNGEWRRVGVDAWRWYEHLQMCRPLHHVRDRY